MDIVQAIKEFGFPVVAACGLGYFIYFIWKWVTETIDPVIGIASCNSVLVAVISLFVNVLKVVAIFVP